MASSGPSDPTSTVDQLLADQADHEQRWAQLRRARLVRRVVLGLLGVLVLAGLAGLVGVRTARSSSTGGGYQLSVTYPSVGRPGLGATWRAEIVRPGGFDGPVDVRVDRTYFELFDENGWSPQPESEVAAGDDVIWTFERPEGDRLVVELDGRFAPSWHWPREGRVAVLDGDAEVVAVTFRTWTLP